MRSTRGLLAGSVLFLLLLAGCSPKHETATSGAASSGAAEAGSAITIGYSDWPGWTAWAIADKEGFFKKHNVNVKLVWFPNYTDSLNAFAANQVDANCQTWSDTMGPLAQGQAAKAVLINDNSAGQRRRGCRAWHQFHQRPPGKESRYGAWHGRAIPAG